MKNLLKILLMFLLARVTPPPAAPTGDEFNYVSFGASTTVGYGLKGFIPMELYDEPSALYQKAGGARDGYYSSGYYYQPSECAPALIAKALQEELGAGVTVNWDNCAINSMRAYDLSYILDENVKADKYIDWRLGNESSGWIHDLNRARKDTINIKGVDKKFEKEETSIRDQFRERIEKADLITYDLGVNDFGVYVSNMINGNLYSNNVGDLIPQYEGLYNEAKALFEEKVFNYYADLLDESTMKTVDFVIDTLAYAYIGFVSSFDHAMEIIYDLNPDVEIVVVSIQNTLAGFDAYIGDKYVPLSDIFGGMIELANAYTKYVSPFANRYYYANVAKNGHVEYFIDEIGAWDEDVDSLSPEVLDAYNVYEKKFLVSTLAEQFVVSKIGVETRNSPGYKETADLEVKNISNNIYYLLSYAIKKCANNKVLCSNGLDPEGAFGAIIGLANNVMTGVHAGTGNDVIQASCKEQIDGYLNSNERISSLLVGIVGSFANSFFSHPNANGHEEMANIILDAYHAKENQRVNDLAYLMEILPDNSDKIVWEVVKPYVEEAVEVVTEKALELAEEYLPTPEQVTEYVVKKVIEEIKSIDFENIDISEDVKDFAGDLGLFEDAEQIKEYAEEKDAEICEICSDAKEDLTETAVDFCEFLKEEDAFVAEAVEEMTAPGIELISEAVEEINTVKEVVEELNEGGNFVENVAEIVINNFWSLWNSL